MIDFVRARRMMVDGQVRTADVTDPRLLAAMLDIPRERFVPGAQSALAYLDLDVPLSTRGPRRCLLKPMVIAKLIHAADVGENDRVLDVACATGYSSALLGRLASAVVALEEDRDLAKAATEALTAVGSANVAVATGPLAAGWAIDGPYDVILVNGSCEVVPEKLFPQLKDGGRLVYIHGSGPAAKAMLYRKANSDVSGRPLFDATAPLLPGFAKPPVFIF